MKYIVSTILSAAIAFSLGLFMPWWSISISGFIVGLLIPQPRILAFLSAFCGVSILWALIAFSISISNDHILAHRVSLLVLQKDSPYALVALTALVGGLTAGISAFTGRSLAIIAKKP